MAALAFAKKQRLVPVKNALGTGKDIELGTLNVDLQEGNPVRFREKVSRLAG
jgi:hypothetical protein